MKTFLLSVPGWDLSLDLSSNIALAEDPYAIAQSVASACRVFLGEEWYNTSAGVPYFQSILAMSPSLQFVKSQLALAASTVPGCNNPIVFLSDVTGDRRLTGQVQFTDSTGVAQVAAF